MIHWLGIEGKNVKIKWAQLKWYVENHSCEVKIYLKVYGDFAYVARLKCNQCYNDLDLEVNSLLSLSMIRYDRKPKGLVESRNPLDHYVKKYVTKDVEESEEVKELIELLIDIKEDRQQAIDWS